MDLSRTNSNLVQILQALPGRKTIISEVFLKFLVTGVNNSVHATDCLRRHRTAY